MTPLGGDRRLHILERLVGTDSAALDLKRLCERTVEVTEMSGAGIMLMSGDIPQGTLCTTNDVSALIEELQFTLGEGCNCSSRRHKNRRTSREKSASGQPWPWC